MGARLYDPYTGRFTSTDPIPGGSANNYDYCNQDPINNLDLGGTLVPNGPTRGHGDRTRKKAPTHGANPPKSIHRPDPDLRRLYASPLPGHHGLKPVRKITKDGKKYYELGSGTYLPVVTVPTPKGGGGACTAATVVVGLGTTVVGIGAGILTGGWGWVAVLTTGSVGVGGTAVGCIYD
jgi:hypothetical protein